MSQFKTIKRNFPEENLAVGAVMDWLTPTSTPGGDYFSPAQASAEVTARPNLHSNASKRFVPFLSGGKRGKPIYKITQEVYQ